MSILLGFCLAYLGILTTWCCCRAEEALSQRAGEKWPVSPCLVYHNPNWACMKIKDLIEKGFYAAGSDCQCLMWFIMLFLCKCISPNTSGICGYSEPKHGPRRKQRAAMMRLVLLRSAGSSHAPQDSRQVPSGRRPCSQISPLLGHVLPLPAQMSGLRITPGPFCGRCPPKGWKQWAEASWD